MAHDIVISYSRRNVEIAERLATLLRERKISVWYDRMIKPGVDWRDEIAAAISGARIFLILFSSESNPSQELRKELAIADRHRLLIIPVRVEQVEPTGLFEYELARRQWFDIFTDWRAGLPAVVDYVAEVIQTQAEAIKDHAPPEEKMKSDAEPVAATWDSRKPTDRISKDPPEDSSGGSHATQTEQSAPRVSPMPAASGRVEWLTAKLMVPVASLFGLLGLVGMAQGPRVAIGFATARLLPQTWLILQIWFVKRAAIGRPYGKSARLIAIAFAAAGLLKASFPKQEVLPWILIPAALGGVGLAIFLLIQTARKSRLAAFWILPLASSVLLMMGLGMPNATITDEAFCGAGLVVGGVAYLIAGLRKPG